MGYFVQYSPIMSKVSFTKTLIKLSTIWQLSTLEKHNFGYIRLNNNIIQITYVLVDKDVTTKGSQRMVWL